MTLRRRHHQINSGSMTVVPVHQAMGVKDVQGGEKLRPPHACPLCFGFPRFADSGLFLGIQLKNRAPLYELLPDTTTAMSE